MSDLIDRQAAIDAFMTSTSDGDKAEWCKWVLKQLPSAQPEIIRCGECKYWQTTWQNDWAPNYHYCPNVDGVRKNDFYCADAERSDDADHTEV